MWKVGEKCVCTRNKVWFSLRRFSQSSYLLTCITYSSPNITQIVQEIYQLRLEIRLLSSVKCECRRPHFPETFTWSTAFTNKFYAKFYKIPKNGLVVDSRSQTHRRTDRRHMDAGGRHIRISFSCLVKA